MKKFKDIDIDKCYVDFILTRTNVFRHIHPNVLSIIGLFIDILIYFSSTNRFLILTAFFMFIRFSCDVLDGAVARKYNKVSDIGGILDTIADNTLIGLLILSITTLAQIQHGWILAITIPMLNLIYMYHLGSIIHHSKMKESGGKFKTIYAFFTRNNCIVYLIAYILIFLLK
jgi:phosphatidylglycerophosphate synthase